MEGLGSRSRLSAARAGSEPTSRRLAAGSFCFGADSDPVPRKRLRKDLP